MGLVKFEVPMEPPVLLFSKWLELGVRDSGEGIDLDIRFWEQFACA